MKSRIISIVIVSIFLLVTHQSSLWSRAITNYRIVRYYKPRVFQGPYCELSSMPRNLPIHFVALITEDCVSLQMLPNVMNMYKSLGNSRDVLVGSHLGEIEYLKGNFYLAARYWLDICDEDSLKSMLNDHRIEEQLRLFSVVAKEAYRCNGGLFLSEYFTALFRDNPQEAFIILMGEIEKTNSTTTRNHMIHLLADFIINYEMYETGLPILREQYFRFPEDSYLAISFAWVRYKVTGNLSESAEIIAKVIREEPENPKAYYLYGRILLEEGQLPYAIENILKAVSLRPDNVQWRITLAKAYVETQQCDKALKTVIEAKSQFQFSQHVNNYYNTFRCP